MPKRDYHTTHPSLNHRQRKLIIEKEKKSFKKMVLFFIFLIIIIVLIYWLFFSPFFQIKKIIISGTEKVEEINQIEEVIREFLCHKRFFILSQKNIFILSKQGLKNIINNRLDVESINLETQLLETLKIKIKNKTPVLIWQQGENYFTVYSDGVIKNKIDNIDQFELPIVNLGTTTEIVIGQKVVSGQQIDYIQKLFSLFNFYFKDLDIKQIILPNPGSLEIKLLTSENWYILFNLDLDPQQTLETVKTVLEQKIEKRGGLKYIDARIKDRVYYK